MRATAVGGKRRGTAAETVENSGWLARPKLREEGMQAGRERRLVSQTLASWNQLAGWLRQIEGLRQTG